MRDDEHREQAALFRWRDWMAPQVPALRRLFAVPNGGHRSKATAGKMKAEGATRGVLDVFLDVPAGGLHGLRIEMKSATGRPTPEQREWIDYYREAGYRAEVCRSWEEAKDVILDYLNEQ